MVAHIPLPGVQSTHHADVTADEPGVPGQFLQGCCRRFEQQVIKQFLVRAGNGSQLRRQGECHQKVVCRQQPVILVFYPLLGFVLTTFGTASVATGMVCIDDLLTIRIFTAIQMPAHLFGAAGGNIVNGSPMAGQHGSAEAINILWSVAAEYIRQLDHGTSEIGHQLIDGFDAHGFGLFSQMCVNTGSIGAAVAQPGLNQTQIEAGFQKVRGPRMP